MSQAVEFYFRISGHAVNLALGETPMRKSIAIHLLTAFTALAGPSPSLMAAVIPPTGLAPGSQYQLIFVTEGTHDALSTSIDVYNSFVTSEAAIGVPFGLPTGATWNAVVTTTSTSANANAQSFPGIPVYNTHGELVALSNTGDSLYTLLLSHAPDYTQRGDFRQTTVWTGGAATSPSLPPTPEPIGTIFAFDNTQTVGAIGLSTEIGSKWLYDDNTTTTSGPQGFRTTVFNSLYALSTPITVVPEPSTFALAVLGILGVTACARRRARSSDAFSAR